MVLGIGRPGTLGKPGSAVETVGSGVVLGGAGALAAAGGGAEVDGWLPSGVGDGGGFETVVDGAFGKSEVNAVGRAGFGCVVGGAVVDDPVVVGAGNGSDTRGWGVVAVLVAAGGRDGSDGDGRGRPGNVIDDDAELADIGSDGENAMKAGTPMSARPNVPAARDPTRRRKVRGIFPTNLLFRMAWLRPSRRLPRNARKHT
jgi:hypothetical protein